MTSHQARIINEMDILSPTMLAIRHPGMDERLIDLYKEYNEFKPFDKGWVITEGPAKFAIQDSANRLQVNFKFILYKHGETTNFELQGLTEKAWALTEKCDEWLLAVSGTLWRWKVNDKDGTKAENVIIPCYYHSHNRKGFGLVPLIISYVVYGASHHDLQRW